MDVIKACLENTRGEQSDHKYSSEFKCIECGRRQPRALQALPFSRTGAL